MKKRIIIQISLFFILPFISSAQKADEKQQQNSIFCTEIDLIVDGFEVSDPSIIRICCGGLFEEGTIPCKVLTKNNYEAFSGQSDNTFNPGKEGFLITHLLEPKKNKLSKLKGNNLVVSIKKGNYTITNEGLIFLEIEYLK
jgi:hypothetical protein